MADRDVDHGRHYRDSASDCYRILESELTKAQAPEQAPAAE
ncbi:hypothetical protein [Aquipseudomonas alcaligenes]|nr:hypothetical protein [Pseudomonas alcaligenes]